MFPFLPRQPLNVHDLFGSCTKGDCPQPPNQHTWSECLVVVGLNKFRIRFGPHPRSAKHPKCPKPEQTYQAPARVPNGLRCLWGVQYTHLEVVDSFFQVPTCIGNRAILSIWGPLEAPSGSSSETPPVGGGALFSCRLRTVRTDGVPEVVPDLGFEEKKRDTREKQKKGRRKAHRFGG